MSSVIREIAKNAGTKYPCRAKNPATCRVHGTFNPVALINDSVAARRNLRASELLKKKATSLEDRIEAEMLADKDQLIYDATGEGLEELRSAKFGADDLTKAAIETRLEAALTYREEQLQHNPEIAKLEAHYQSVINQPGAKTYAIGENGRVDDATLAILNAVPYGTPVAFKLRHGGGYVYNTAGDGIVRGYDSLKLWEKAFLKRRGFFSNQQFSGGERRSLTVALQGHQESAKRFESVTVLPAGTNPVPNELLDGVNTSDYDLDGSGYRVVIGKDYAFVGDMRPGRMTWDKGVSTRYYNMSGVSVDVDNDSLKTVNVKLA